MSDNDLQKAWNRFYSTGRVSDYLALCNVKINFFAEKNSEGKNSHRRTGYKGAPHG